MLLNRIFLILVLLLGSSAVSVWGQSVLLQDSLPEGAASLCLDSVRRTDAVVITAPDDSVSSDVRKKIESEIHGADPWWKQMLRGRLSLSDTTVRYPRFIKFCVDVYNWGDRTFNSYDTTYVVGTGRRWKARLTSDNWVDSYALNLGKRMPIWILSDIYCNAGGYLQYMAVSMGYTFDLSNLIGNQPANHKKLEFGFNCARFNIEMHFWQNTGGSYIRKFGKYNEGHIFKKYFPGVYMKDFDVTGCFFFNNRKYSQGAAYNFSKIQKKSAGSWLIGFSYTNLDARLNFYQLPHILEPYLTVEKEDYRLHYNSYTVLTGYGFNWVLNPHLLLNFTVMPEIGITSCFDDSYEASKTLLALNFRGRTSLTYNLKDFFVCLVGKIDGTWYNSGATSIFSSVENLSLSTGIRF